MSEREYFFNLYEIASHLNREFSLSSALRKSLEQTVELLDLETGWIWLAEKDLKSVYLAASFNLPPALKNHPERLSGWCYCIQHYLSGKIEEATNISEITCTRLKEIKTGTMDLKFHATIPINIDGQKVGLINLLSKEKQQLNDKKLSILNTLSELIGIAVRRTRLQEAHVKQQSALNGAIHDVLKRVIDPRIRDLQTVLRQSIDFANQDKMDNTRSTINDALGRAKELREQINLLLSESTTEVQNESIPREFAYPSSPLTKRELEVLTLVKSGKTNAQIADRLYISQRTVKFHVTSILSKLYAKTRTQAVDIALNRGLISP